MKYLPVLFITLVIIGCQKEEPKTPLPPISMLWSEGFPHDADAYNNLSQQISDVIHEQGYPIDNITTTRLYDSHFDPQLAVDLRPILEEHMPENRVDHYMSYLSNPDFIAATTPQTAFKVLSGMAEGRRDVETGEWTDPSDLKGVSQAYLDWITDQNNKVLLLMEGERPDINPGTGGSNIGSYPNYYHPTHPDSGRDIVVASNSHFADASGFAYLSYLADEIASSQPVGGGDTQIAEVIEGIAAQQLGNIYAANYGPGVLKHAYDPDHPNNMVSKDGAKAADLALLSYLSGTIETPAIKAALGKDYLKSLYSKSNANGDNLPLELILLLQGGLTSNDSTMTQPINPTVSNFYNRVFTYTDPETGARISPNIGNFSLPVLNRITENMHRFFDYDENRKIIEKQLY